jgi:HAD superfamily hydrolase (TIGR01549 family)
LERLDSWATALESRGRTPSILEQAKWLQRLTDLPVAGSGIAEELDALIARAPVRVAPGARSALRALDRAGIRLGVVSNLLHETGRGARELLDSFGLLESYSVTVFSDEHPWSKPRPEPFRYALSCLGVRAVQAAHIGDLTYDTQGAASAGMTAFLYTGLHPFEPPHLRRLARATVPAEFRVARWAEVPDRILTFG